MSAKNDLCEKGVIVFAGNGKVIAVPGKDIVSITYAKFSQGTGIIVSLINGEKISWVVSKPDIYIKLVALLKECNQYYYVIKGSDSIYIVENEYELKQVLAG